MLVHFLVWLAALDNPQTSLSEGSMAFYLLLLFIRS